MKTDMDVLHKICEELNIKSPSSCVFQRCKQNILDFLSTLRDDIQVVVETEYADPVFRDSFYHLYSRKFQPYVKDCIRLSFFEPIFTSSEDVVIKSTTELQEVYRGFLVIRPVIQCIGRNAIDPKAKKEVGNVVEICKATIKATCVGHKLSVSAFPHSSQDGEHMSCAETSIWSMLEYFGNKYAIYDPILPSQILSTLKDNAIERIVPTVGLSYMQIAALLRKRNFETKIYHVDNPKFRELYTCYIESGLPLITVIQATGLAHAVVTIGRTQVNATQISHSDKHVIEGRERSWNSWNRNIAEFVVNDDNFPCYRTIRFDNPASGYPLVKKDDEITSFIVPLHAEILVPAEIAFTIRDMLLDSHEIDGCIEKTFLTTSRSFREYVVSNPDFSAENKQCLLQKALPKFVWLIEVFDSNDLTIQKTKGTFVIDATGNTRNGDMFSVLLFSIVEGRLEDVDSDTGEYVVGEPIFPQRYQMFNGNLKK